MKINKATSKKKKKVPTLENKPREQIKWIWNWEWERMVGGGDGKCCPLQSLQTKAECKKSSSSLLPFSEEPVSTFSPDLKSLHENQPISTFFPPTQKADPGKAKLACRISPPHPPCVNLTLRIFVSLQSLFLSCFSSLRIHLYGSLAFSISLELHPSKSLPAPELP